MKLNQSNQKPRSQFLALMLASTMTLSTLVPVTATSLQELEDQWTHNGGALESVEGNRILVITAGESATSNRIGTDVSLEEGMTVRFKFYCEDVSVLKAGFKLYQGGTSSSNEVARFKLDQGTLKQANESSTYSDSGSMSASYSNIGSVESGVWHEFTFHYTLEEGGVLTDVYLDGVKLNGEPLTNPTSFIQLDAISFITDSNSEGSYQLDDIQVEAGLSFLEEETDTEVEEETDTDVEEETDTDVEEETDTDVEEETDTDVEEETDADVEEETETDVEEETDTDVEEETDTDVEEDTDTEGELEVDPDFSVDSEEEFVVDPDFSVDSEEEFEVDPDFSVDSEEEFEVDPDFSVTPENQEEDSSDEGVMVPTTTPTDRFVDVEYTHWFAEYVDYVVEAGIMSGMSDDEFGPTVNTSRAMIATIIATVSGQDISHAVNRFQDVEDDKWYTQPIAWCAENGIVTGFTPDTFGVTNDITREQLVTTLYGFATYLKLNVSVSSVTALDEFADGSRVSDYAKTPMTWAIERGVIAGADNQLNPQNTATRAEVATIFKSFLELTV